MRPRQSSQLFPQHTMLASLLSLPRAFRLPLPRRVPSGTTTAAAADSHADPAQADLALLARALHQLLAKWPPRVAQRHFPNATKAYQALRIQFCLAGPARLPPHLLSDLCHEIAEHVDASVRQAAVRCMRRHASAR